MKFCPGDLKFTFDRQELAPEWFCGCKHNGKSSGGGAGDVKETKNHKNKVRFVTFR